MWKNTRKFELVKRRYVNLQASLDMKLAKLDKIREDVEDLQTKISDTLSEMIELTNP